MDSALLQDEIQRGKLGKIGTSGRGVVSLRFDHQVDPFIADVLPLLVERGLPGSMGVVSRSIGNMAADYEPTAATWADIGTSLLANGIEVWSHSCTHSDGASLTDEIVASKTEIETALPTCRVMGWQQPGSPATYGPAHTSAASFDDEAGQLIRATYGLYESSIPSSRRLLPTNGCRGLNHQTIDSQSVATVKGWVDVAANRQLGAQLMLHARVLDEPGYMTTAQFTEVLDYIVSLRDAGKIEVLTASGLAFADPGSSHRPSLIPNGDFEAQSTGLVPAFWTGSGAAWSVRTDGGHAGYNFLRIPAGQTVAIVSVPMAADGLDGHAFEFRGWFRSTGNAATWRVQFTAYINGGYSVVKNRTAASPIPASQHWTSVHIPVVVPKGAGDLYVAIGRTGSTGTVDWDDVSLVAI